MVEFSSPPSAEPSDGTSRFRIERRVLFRMVAGQGLIGLLVLIAILVCFWQLNTYNDARQVWMDMQDRLSLISDAQQASTVLVLVTHRVVFTQAPFPSMVPESQRDPLISITSSVNDLEFSRESLEEETASLLEADPINTQLIKAVDLMDNLINIATQSREYGLAADWETAQVLISEPAPTSLTPQFDKFHTDLLAKLRQAYILTQGDAVSAQKQMNQALYIGIAVSVSVLVTVILLGIGLSVAIIRSITEPINELSSAATQLAAGHFAVRVPATRHDEFGHLAKVFNDMAARLGEIYAGMDQEIRELRIVLDEAQQKEKVAEIIETDYFRRLTVEGAKLREIMSS